MPKDGAQEKAMDLTRLLIPEGPAKNFEQHLVKTQVSTAVLETLDTMPDPGPIILLNFVCWRPDRDPTSWKYGMVVKRHLLSRIKVCESHNLMKSAMLSM